MGKRVATVEFIEESSPVKKYATFDYNVVKKEDEVTTSEDFSSDEEEESKKEQPEVVSKNVSVGATDRSSDPSESEEDVENEMEVITPKMPETASRNGSGDILEKELGSSKSSGSECSSSDEDKDNEIVDLKKDQGDDVSDGSDEKELLRKKLKVTVDNDEEMVDAESPKANSKSDIESSFKITALEKNGQDLVGRPVNLAHLTLPGNKSLSTPQTGYADKNGGGAGSGEAVESLVREKRKKKNKLGSVRNESATVDVKNEVPEINIEHKKDGFTNSLHEPVKESLKEMDAGTPLHGKDISKPENLLLEKPLGDEQQVTSAGLPVKPVESLVSEKRKKKPASIQEEVSSTLLEASLDAEAKDIANTRKKKKRTTKTSDAETCLPSSGAENNDRTRDVVPVTSKSEVALDTDHPGLPVKPVESLVSGKRRKKPASIQEEVSSTLLEASLDADAKDIANTRKKKKRTTKTSDAETCLPSSGAENNDRTRDVFPVTSKSEIALDTDHPGLPVKPVGSLVSEKRKKKPASIQEEVSSTLKRKLLEASLDAEAEDTANTRKKKKRTTKSSDAETCLPSSGAENNDRTRDVVPVTSKSEFALDTDHPGRETEKAGKSLPPTAANSRTSEMRTTDAPSLCLENGSDKDCGIGDNTSLMESLKTEQNSKNVAESPKENRKQVNTPFKKVTKSRIGKATADNNSSEYVPEVAMDSLCQVLENSEPIQLPSDILEYNEGKRPLEENYESDEENGTTNENTKSSAADNQKLVAPAKGSEVKQSDKSLKVGVGKNLLPQKKSNGVVSDTVQVSKDGHNNPAPQPDMKATVRVDETPVKVLKKKVVSASGNATPIVKKVVNASGNATPVISHLDISSRVKVAQKKINALAESSSNTESTVGRVKKNKGGIVIQQSHAKARIPISNQIEKVLNASNSQRSLLTSKKPIFKESSESSQELGGEVNNSEASTQTPSDSSSSGEDSPGASGGRRMDSDETQSKFKKNISLDAIFRSSQSYKKAKSIALSEAEDPDEVMSDTQA